MKKAQLIQLWRERRGTVLITAFGLIMLAAVATLLLVQTLLDHQRLNTRRRELWKAFYLAEAGIAQIQQWALYPDEYTVNPNLFEPVDSSSSSSSSSSSGLVSATVTFETKYPVLYNAVHASSNGYQITQEMLAQMDVGQFNSTYEYDAGRIEHIELLPPDASDPIPCVFKIQSTGTSPRGMERTVLGYANMNPALAIKIPAALISFNTVATGGNAMVHWGEVWAKSDVAMQSQNQYSYLNSDPYAIWRTEGQINSWGGGWRVNTAKNPDILTAQDDMGVKNPWTGRFLQNQPTDSFPGEWPDFDYQTFKEMAQAHGRYYSTDAAGNIYRDGVEDAAHLVDFLTEFGVADRDEAPYDLVFIDTIDGNEPAADGSNLSTISASGNSLGLKGVFYLGANFDVTGVGSPPAASATDPDGNDCMLSNIFLSGVMYAAGTMEMGGNAGVYGSVVAERGFEGGGTPDVYYNSDLSDGLNVGDGNVGAVFKVTLQTNY